MNLFGESTARLTNRPLLPHGVRFRCTCSVIVHKHGFPVRAVVEVDVNVVAGVRHMDDVLAMEGVNGFSEGCAGFLGAEAVLVVAMALWRFLYG